MLLDPNEYRIIHRASYTSHGDTVTGYCGTVCATCLESEDGNKRTQLSVCVCMCEYIYVYVRVYEFMCVCLCICVCVSVYMCHM